MGIAAAKSKAALKPKIEPSLFILSVLPMREDLPMR
jgi:hypothetical protein